MASKQHQNHVPVHTPASGVQEGSTHDTLAVSVAQRHRGDERRVARLAAAEELVLKGAEAAGRSRPDGL